MKDKKMAEKLLHACENMRKNMPHFTMFGDDNWKDLDLQIRLLNDFISGKSTDWFDKYEAIDRDENRGAVDCKDWIDDDTDEYEEILNEDWAKD